MNYFRRLVNIFKSKKEYFIHESAIIGNNLELNIGLGSEIWEYVVIRNNVNLKLGQFVQIGPFTVIFPGGNIEIHDNVMIGPHCVFAGANHDYIQTIEPMRFAGDVSKGPIIVEKNVWIAANCTITDGVTIGHDAVIAANSVVSKDVKPFEIVGGVPAKNIGFRK